MTSSGLSLSTSVSNADTLVDEDMDNDEDVGSVASADTVIESVLESKEPANDDSNIPSASMEKLALLVDVAAASAVSSLTTPPSTPPPSARRSMRTVRPLKKQQDIDNDEKEKVIERPRTRLAGISAPATAVKRRKRTKRF